MKFADSMHKCTVHIGLGQDDSDYIDLSQQRDIMKELLFLAFRKAGFANQTLGENKLLPCSMGTFVNSSADDPSDMKCLECPAGGFYTDTKAYVNDSCQRCANGTFVHYNNAPGKSQFDCKACPQGTNTSEFAGFRACKCLNGFSRTHMFEGCTPCDPQGGLKCLNDYATLKSGYWWQWRNETHRELYKNFTINLNNSFYSPTLHANSSVANNSLIEYPHTLPRPYRCPMQNACKGGLDSQLCHDGYKGPLCDVCSDKYYKQLNACKECPTNAWMAGQLSILAVVIVLFIIVVVWKSKTKSKKSTGRSFMDILLGRTKIVIGFYQVTNGVLEAFSYIKWPNSLALIGQYSAIIQLNILQITPVHCVISALKADAFTSLFAIMGLNGTAVILAFASYGLIKLVSLRNNLNEEEKLKKTAHAKQVISRNLFFFLYVTYLSTCFKTAQVLPLACRELCVDENDNICDKFLKADYNIKCTGTRYTRLVIVAYFAVLYVILLPTVSLIVIWRQRRVIRATEKETGNEETNVEDQTTGVFTGLRFLYDNYNPDAWFWELVETARKVILTSGLILIGGESRAYIGLACVISGLYGIYFAYKKPIIDRFENGLMVTSLSVTFVNLVIGAVSSIPEEGISSTIDPYVDDVMFNILVFGVNSVVIGLLVVQYLLYVYRYMKEWRKHPQWSLSCCLALILPLNDLQGELRGMTGRNVLKQQLNTGRIDMPSMGRALKDSGAIDFGLEDDPSSLTADSEHPEETTHTKRSDLEEGVLTIAEVCIHQMPRGTYDTKL